MKYLTVIMIAASLVFVSCGSKKSGNERGWNPELKPCGATKDLSAINFCLPQAKWTMLVYKEDFPNKIELKLNGYKIIDECAGRVRPFNVMRGSITNIIAQRYNLINEDEKLKVEIIDKGSDCLGQKMFYFNDDQTFDVETIGTDQYVDLEIS